MCTHLARRDAISNRNEVRALTKQLKYIHDTGVLQMIFH